MGRYFLKNKDKILIEFDVEKVSRCIEHRDIHEYKFHIKDIDTDLYGIFPFESQKDICEDDLLGWISCRTSRLGMKIFSMFSKYLDIASDDPMRFVKISDLLSLNDTFWISHEDDGRKWEDVSPYGNSFSDMIVKIIFEKGHHHISQTDIPLCAPEITTKGVLKKSWTRNEDGISLRKADDYFHTPEKISQVTSEWFASQVCDVFGIEHVRYDLDIYVHSDGKKEDVCLCKLFTNEHTGFIDAKTYFSCKGFPQKDLTLNRLQNVDIQLELATMFGKDAFEDIMVFDALILNQDRHLGNFGHLFDTDTGELLRPAPIFDNGFSFCVGLGSIDDIDIEDIASRHRAAYLSFDTQAKLFIRDRHVPALERCLDISLEGHPVVDIPSTTISRLTKLIRKRAEQLLKIAAHPSRIEKEAKEEDRCILGR